jgi:16S rRNA (uracil1498-N3)-methyltransferase
VEKRALRVFVTPLQEGEHELEHGPLHYVTRVHRLRAGDRFTAFDPVARMEADGELLEVHRRGARCRLGPPRAAREVSALELTLVQALGRGDRPDRVVRDATALGATSIVLAETQHSVPQPGERGEGRSRRWQSIAIEAARQCGRGDLPRIEGPIGLDAALGSVAERIGPKLCLQAGADLSLRDALATWQPTTPITLLIGPEGGLSEAELDQARAAGFVLTSLGRFVLRTETAATAALGAIASRLG